MCNNIIHLLIHVPGSSPLPLSLVVLVRVFVPTLTIPTLFIFPSSKMSLLLQMVHCYLDFLPFPIRPCSHHHPSAIHALVVAPPWLIVVLIAVLHLHFHFLSISDCVPILSDISTLQERNAVTSMCADEGQRARTLKNARGGPTKSLDDGQRAWMRRQRKVRTENVSMDIVRAVDGVSDSGQKVSLSLSACKRTDDESCAGGWVSMIDTGGAMSIIVGLYYVLQ